MSHRDKKVLQKLFNCPGDYHHAVFMEQYEQAELYWKEIELLKELIV